MHSELFDGLGFRAQKNEQAKKKNKQMREMIFPHLKMINKCEKKDCGGNCACREPVPEDLIILDEQQEDEDDVDV